MVPLDRMPTFSTSQFMSFTSGKGALGSLTAVASGMALRGVWEEEGATGEPNWNVVRGEAPESAAGGEKPPKAGAAAAVPGLANGNPCAVQRSVLSSSLSLCWLV